MNNNNNNNNGYRTPPRNNRNTLGRMSNMITNLQRQILETEEQLMALIQMTNEERQELAKKLARLKKIKQMFNAQYMTAQRKRNRNRSPPPAPRKTRA